MKSTTSMSTNKLLAHSVICVKTKRFGHWDLGELEYIQPNRRYIRRKLQNYERSAFEQETKKSLVSTRFNRFDSLDGVAR